LFVWARLGNSGSSATTRWRPFSPAGPRRSRACPPAIRTGSCDPWTAWAMAPNVPLVNSAADAESPPASCRCPGAMSGSCGPIRVACVSGEGGAASRRVPDARGPHTVPIVPTILGFASARCQTPVCGTPTSSRVHLIRRHESRNTKSPELVFHGLLGDDGAKTIRCKHGAF
jgi:hypothetical protein